MQSYYTTPRRRHSSLFQRMENQIKKISRKLSAAKESYRDSRETRQNSTANKKQHFRSFNSIEDKGAPTVRRVREHEQMATHLKSMTAPLKRRLSNVAPMAAQTIDLKTPHPSEFHSSNSNANKIILKLQSENSKLAYQLGKIESVCEQQSYKLGYLKAELKQVSKKLQYHKEKQMKEASYLETLLEHYKSKAKKYKKMLRVESEVSIEVAGESQSNA